MGDTHKKLPKVIISFKSVGETPLEVIRTLKRESKEFKDVSVTYAGRLDPMAEGVLVLLIGDEVHEKERYLKLDKTYSFEVLFGFSTDSYDMLGKIVDSEDGIVTNDLIKTAIKKLIGTYNQEYPPYSSKPVEGRPLFEWAREGRLHEIELPLHKITVSKLSFDEIYEIKTEELKKIIEKNISLVSGDFRQKEIKELWDAYIDNSMMNKFQVASFSTTCSSGTYVRAIVHELGRILGVPTTTFHIKRESVGEYFV